MAVAVIQFLFLHAVPHSGLEQSWTVNYYVHQPVNSSKMDKKNMELKLWISNNYRFTRHNTEKSGRLRTLILSGEQK